MNLIGDPWIPVLSDAEAPRLVSLRELFEQADRIRDLHATPPQRIALMRLLICIAQAALDGPADGREWAGCRPRISPESLRYLASRHDRFELFGQQPFSQVPSLIRKRNAVCDKLDFGLSAGNNTTLHDQAADPAGRPHKPGWLALMLLTSQCFSPGGLIGENKWSGTGTGKTSEHSPCIEGSPLHLIVRGETLLETLHLNLLTKQQLAELPNATWGQPSWDHPPRGPGLQLDHAISYLARLVPMPRAILLEPEALTFTLAAGVSYAKLPDYREPSTTTIKRGKGDKEHLSYLNINLERHPWRDLDAVLAMESKESRGPLALEHLVHLDNDGGVVTIWTGGLVADKGKILDVAEWEFSFLREQTEEKARRQYRAGVELAEKGAERLAKAIASYCAYLKANNTFIGRARTAYWGRLDQAYSMLLDAVAANTGFEDWETLIQRTVSNAYAQTCPRESPRQIQAFALARRHLWPKKEKTMPKPDTESPIPEEQPQ